MTDRVGQQLGNYRLVQLLGQGGFANVYLGQHLHLDSQAAIKVMHTHLAQEEWESFRKEARIVAALEHPHIVRLLDFDVEEGTPFLVMQLAPNGSLRRRHAPGLPLLPHIVVPYVRQVAEALDYVHAHKLIHRDIKPENMLLGERDEVLLSDFGVAIIAQSSRQQSSQNIGGTVAYMAPEQIQSKPCPASDQYALGVVVYEWLTGTRPFEGSFTEIASKHILVTPQPLSALAPALSPAIEEVVLRALAKEPQERFPTVQAFAQALEAAAGAEQTTTLPSSHLALTAASTSTTVKAAAEDSLRTRALIETPPLSLGDVAAPIAPNASPKRGVSRRAVVLGLAGLAAAGGSLSWWALNNGLLATSQAAQATPTPRSLHLPPTGTLLLDFDKHTDHVYTVAWSPDGTKIASGGKDTKVLVWDVRTGRVLITFDRHTGNVNAVAWSPDGTLIASGSDDTLVHVWDATSGELQYTYSGHKSYVGTLAWSPDSKMIASGSGYPSSYVDADLDHTVHVWYVQKRALLFSPYTGHAGQIKQVAWSPDGTRIASASVDNTAQVWSASDGTPIFTFTKHTDEVWAVCWSPNGVWLASGSGYTNKDVRPSIDTSVQVWNVTTTRPQDIKSMIYNGHTDVVEAVAWSPDSTRIASASDDKKVQVWEAV